MAFTPRSNSRFVKNTPILTVNGEPTYGLAKKFNFMDRDNLIEGEIASVVVDSRTAGRPDLLALDIYGNSDLHWIIIMFNRIENPFNWPLNGQIVQYPVKRVVFAEL